MRIWWIAGALLCAAAACQRKDAPPAPAPAQPDTGPLVSPDGITLVSAGREPRRALRYHLAKGTTTPLELAVDVDMQAGAAAALASGGGLPTLVLEGSLVVDDVLPSGDMVVHVQIDHASARARGVPQATVDVFAAQAKQFEGFTESAILSPTGHLSAAHVGGAAGSAASAQVAAMADHFEQIAIPLPAAPVGPGASWSIARPASTNGIAMTVTTTTALVAIDGERASYTATSQVAGADQHTQIGGLALDVKHVSGSGDGSGSVDLATLAVHGTFTTAVHLEAIAGSDSEQLGMLMTIAINQPQTL